ncbi:MAG TPA: DMT family transporter [Propionibacteriaceae bacterium]|nr:DMT family transporter [Propionibacteriaceae bacterium]
MLSRGTRAELLPLAALLAVTAIWGSTFFLIKDVVTRIPVVDLLAVRFALAALALALFVGPRLRLTRRLIGQGVGLGLLYGGAQILQTLGLAHTSASTSGFVTGLYVVATPLLAALILKTRIGGTTWLAVLLAAIGLGVLSLQGFSIGYGELVTVIAAVVYAGHIVALSKISTRETVLSLSLVQLVSIALVCTGAALWPTAGSPRGIVLPDRPADWLIVVYLAVLAGTVTMVLQTWAQARVEPTRAAVIMAMEPVWAAGFAVALGGESLTLRLIIGGLAILTAMYLVELAPRSRNRQQEYAA